MKSDTGTTANLPLWAGGDSGAGVFYRACIREHLARRGRRMTRRRILPARPGLHNQPDQSAAIDPEQKAKEDAAQQAHEAADTAQETLDNATQARDQLESDGAAQDQIDAANRQSHRREPTRMPPTQPRRARMTR